ncbi:MAG: DUF2791 family P-loop domain-containing protein [Comamonadaceae bacterium]|nr:DUF2791 family P-loop domain-containing protein [Comamonadaceae bacterium]
MQINETETPLHRLETVYRRLVERLGTSGHRRTARSAASSTAGSTRWSRTCWPTARTDAERRRGAAGAHRRADGGAACRRSASSAPAFSAVLRAYRRALRPRMTHRPADGLIGWLAGQPNVAAQREARGRREGRPRPLRRRRTSSSGLLTILRDSGYAGLLLVLDEVETLQRMRADTREKGLNALRQWIDEIDAGRFPGLYLVVTGTPAFFDGPQGVQRLAPLAQRLHVDFRRRQAIRQPAGRPDPPARVRPAGPR